MSNMMKALVKARPEPGLWMEQVPVPEPGPGEVLIRVGKSAICGTDVHIWNWDAWAAQTVPVPLVTGHEFSGVIADTGSADDLAEPDRRQVAGHCLGFLAGVSTAGKGKQLHDSIGKRLRQRHRGGALRQ